MGFNIPETGTEITYISEHDDAIDWEATSAQHGFTRETYSQDPLDPDKDANSDVICERMKQFIFLDGEDPVVFTLKIPSSSAINRAIREEKDYVSATYRIICNALTRASGLTHRGQPLPELVKHRKAGVLDEKYENAIPSPVLMSIGAYLIDRGDGIDSPLQS